MLDTTNTSISHKPIPLLATVALLHDVPEHGLMRGEVGTVVEIFPPDAVEVEFVDEEGHVYAMEAFQVKDLVALYRPAVRQVA